MSTTITNYATLVAAVQEWSNRSDAATVARIPDFIAEAERRLFRRLRCPGNESIAVYDIGDYNNVNGIPIPQDLLECRWLTYDITPLERISDQKLLGLLQSCPASGEPKYFGRVADKFGFWPTALENRPVRMSYFVEQGPLSDLITTTKMLVVCPMVYVYGACAEIARWTRDDKELIKWDTLTDELIASLNYQAQDNEVDGSTVTSGYAA
jgi:hypothetical protein